MNNDFDLFIVLVVFLIGFVFYLYGNFQYKNGLKYSSKVNAKKNVEAYWLGLYDGTNNAFDTVVLLELLTKEQIDEAFNKLKSGGYDHIPEVARAKEKVAKSIPELFK